MPVLLQDKREYTLPLFRGKKPLYFFVVSIVPLLYKTIQFQLLNGPRGGSPVHLNQFSQIFLNDSRMFTLFIVIFGPHKPLHGFAFIFGT